MDAKTLLDRILQGRTEDGAGAASTNGNSLASLLTPHARRRLASLGAASGLAAMRRLARQAWADNDDWSVAPISGASAPATPLGEEERARVLLEAMVAAAKVDRGAEGMQHLVASSAQARLTAEEQAFFRAQLERPTVLDDVARRVKTRGETIEVYAASCLVADASRPLSRHYLDMLAARLGLERALVERIEQTIAANAS